MNFKPGGKVQVIDNWFIQLGAEDLPKGKIVIISNDMTIGNLLWYMDQGSYRDAYKHVRLYIKTILPLP